VEIGKKRGKRDRQENGEDRRTEARGLEGVRKEKKVKDGP